MSWRAWSPLGRWDRPVFVECESGLSAHVKPALAWAQGQGWSWVIAVATQEGRLVAWAGFMSHEGARALVGRLP